MFPRHWKPLLAAVSMLGLTSCGLANAAMKTPGNLIKGMTGAVGRTMRLGANDQPTDKQPFIDHDSLREYRESLQSPPQAPKAAPVASLAQNETVETATSSSL